MKFDFTVTLGDVLAIAATIAVPVCGTIAVSTWSVVRKMSDLAKMLRYYPPHRHVGKQIEYPPDFEPGSVEDFGEKKVVRA